MQLDNIKDLFFLFMNHLTSLSFLSVQANCGQWTLLAVKFAILSRIIFFILLRLSNHQIVHKKQGGAGGGGYQVLIPQSRSLFTTIPHPNLLSSLFRIPFWYFQTLNSLCIICLYSHSVVCPNAIQIDLKTVFKYPI